MLARQFQTIFLSRTRTGFSILPFPSVGGKVRLNKCGLVWDLWHLNGISLALIGVCAILLVLCGIFCDLLLYYCDFVVISCKFVSFYTWYYFAGT